MARGLFIGIVVLVVLVAGIVIFMQSGSQDNMGTSSGQQEQTSPTLGEEQIITETQPAAQPPVTEFSIEADDRGFYMNGADIDSISASLGSDLKITFNVRSTGVYYGGLDFRGCGFTTERVSPGGSTTVEFTMENTCTISSYWPSSSRLKDRLQVLAD